MKHRLPPVACPGVVDVGSKGPTIHRRCGGTEALPQPSALPSGEDAPSRTKGV